MSTQEATNIDDRPEDKGQGAAQCGPEGLTMTTPRKPRPPKINTPADDGAGWVLPDHARKPEEPTNYFKLLPEKLRLKLSRFPADKVPAAAERMFYVIHRYRTLTGYTPARADDAEDLAGLRRAIAETIERIDRIPLGAEAWIDTYRQPPGEYGSVRADARRTLEQMAECVDHAIEEHTAMPKMTGRPTTEGREKFLSLPLQQIAADLAPDHFSTGESRERFAAECADVLGIRTPIDPNGTKRKRKKSSPRS